jgi:hypothetical protein
MENNKFKPISVPTPDTAKEKKDEYVSKDVHFDYENVNLDRISLKKVNETEKHTKLFESGFLNNLDKYETEKIQVSLDEINRVASTIQRYIDKMKELEEKGIHVTGIKHTFDQLRYSGALFGPNGEFGKIRNLKLQMDLILDKINTLENSKSFKE